MTKLKSQNSVFSKIFKEFDIYKQELEKYGCYCVTNCRDQAANYDIV
jgi:hypothetical protein